jgi:hypothetical protein
MDEKDELFLAKAGPIALEWVDSLWNGQTQSTLSLSRLPLQHGPETVTTVEQLTDFHRLITRHYRGPKPAWRVARAVLGSQDIGGPSRCPAGAAGFEIAGGPLNFRVCVEDSGEALKVTQVF